MRNLRLLMLLAACLALRTHALDSGNVVPGTGSVEYAFTPGADAAGLVVRRIDAARSQILVQAFTFTHRDIADALVRAQRRGVDVQVIVDKEQADAAESAAMHLLLGAGVPIFTDGEHSAAHNKVLVIDHAGEHPALITGSFNFTFAAQNRNAENVLVLSGNSALTDAFYRNWRSHREHALALPHYHR